MSAVQEWIEKLKSPEYGQELLVVDGHNNNTNISETVLNKRIEEIIKADESYPGGLKNYLERAKKLLKDSSNNVNPYEGYIALQPEIESPEVGSLQFCELEREGLALTSKTAFVLVAGGLGERLGYAGIKVGLWTSQISEMTYLEYYCRTILKYQKKAESLLPLAVMLSEDTFEGTIKLLEENKYFGLKKEQVHLLLQEKVPALLDNDAHIATNGKDGGVQLKPHGHGDVHTLIYQKGLSQKWLKEGLEYLFIFQDTNAIAFRALPVMLGVSKKNGFAMNSLCLPRVPGEAVGAVCRLVKEGGDSELTINVEYNQLDALFKAAGMDGDVPVKGSKYSKYPGNANVLLFNLKVYNQCLETTHGAVPEFVNPKYADAQRSVFKKATRLECMMQEFARLLPAHETHGCTMLPRWLVFSPVKNAIDDAVAKTAKGVPGECALSGEVDFFVNCCRLLEIGATLAENCKVEIATCKLMSLAGMKTEVPPMVFFDPSWATCLTEVIERLDDSEFLKIKEK